MNSNFFVNRLFCQLVCNNIGLKDNELDIGKFMDAVRSFCAEGLVLCPGIKQQNVDVSTSNVVSTDIPFSRHMSKVFALVRAKKLKNEDNHMFTLQILDKIFVESEAAEKQLKHQVRKQKN